jgi:hypothetical protein
LSLIEYIDNFEEVDTAMFEKLSGCIIDNKEVPVTYYSPDVDLTELAKPTIVLYRTPPFPDNSRWQQDEVRDNYIYDENNTLVSISRRKPPEPWSILYTVRTVYEFQQDGVLLNRFLYRKFPRGSFISVKGIGYDVSYAGGSLSGSGYKDFGKTEKGKKTFGETYNYRVDILLDIHERESTKVVHEVGLQTSQK